jgi:hypothetical protein
MTAGEGERHFDALRAQPKFARRIKVIWLVHSLLQKYSA